MPPCGILPQSMSRWTSLGLAMAFVLCLTLFARADTVSGRVYDAAGHPVANASFTAVTGRTRVTFSTDDAGYFSVYLDPGTYTVYSADNTLVGTIHGYPQSATEDIHLTRK
jgi:Carboxypeptidase regulatory-like domain